MKKEYTLAINPGATSTKIAVFEGAKSYFQKNVDHSCGELAGYSTLAEQLPYRKQLLMQTLEDAGIPLDAISIIMARGGLLYPIESGVYEVNDQMIEDLKVGVMGEHASNLGGLLARELLSICPQAKGAFIANPVVVDELQDVARISGHPEFERISIFHALNQKAVARNHAHSQGRAYEDMNLVVAHLGSGISVGAHHKGRVIDVNNALDGEGPFGPERSGTLPTGALTKYAMKKAGSPDEIKKMLVGEGGLQAYVGHKDVRQIEAAANAGDQEAGLLHNAMAYQVSKEIGAMSTVLKGEVDAILLTGGIAHNQGFCDYIRAHVSHIAQVVVYPGEDEMRALAFNGLRLLKGEAEVKVYQGKRK